MSLANSALHSSLLDFDAVVGNPHCSKQQLRDLLAAISAMIDGLAAQTRQWALEIATVSGGLISDRFAFALRNRTGFTKDDAKKLFYSFRRGKQHEEGGGADEPEKPDPAHDVNEAKTTDEKIERIIVYMRETSTKLDRIEDDINFLKNQVDRILEKL